MASRQLETLDPKEIARLFEYHALGRQVGLLEYRGPNLAPASASHGVGDEHSVARSAARSMRVSQASPSTAS